MGRARGFEAGQGVGEGDGGKEEGGRKAQRPDRKVEKVA